MKVEIIREEIKAPPVKEIVLKLTPEEACLIKACVGRTSGRIGDQHLLVDIYEALPGYIDGTKIFTGTNYTTNIRKRELTELVEKAF